MRENRFAVINDIYKFFVRPCLDKWKPSTKFCHVKIQLVPNSIHVNNLESRVSQNLHQYILHTKEYNIMS